MVKNNSQMGVKLCLPAMIYLILGAISIIMSFFSKETVMHVVVSVLFVLFWTFILNLICSAGYEMISWILLLFPLIVFVCCLLFGVRLISVMHKNMS